MNIDSVSEAQGIQHAHKEANALPKAKIDNTSIGRSVHRLSSLRSIQAQYHPELVRHLQTLIENLDSIPETNLQHDITQIKKALAGTKSDKEKIIQKIDSLTESLVKKTCEGIKYLPAEILVNICSYLPKVDVFRLQAVSTGFAQLEAVVEAKSAGSRTVVRNAINETLRKKKPLSSLERALTLSLRSSVHYLSLDMRYPITHDNLCGIAQVFPNIDCLDISETKRSATYVQPFSNFTNLKTLESRKNNLKNEDIAALFALADQLTVINFSGNGLLDGSTFDLLPTGLLCLSAMYCSITTVATLSKHTQLKNLLLAGNKNIDEQTIAQLPSQLESLCMYDCNSSNALISHITHLKNLKSFNCTHSSNIDGSTFDLLPGSIEHLQAICCSITNEHMVHFSKLICLKHLDLSGNEALDGSTFAQSLPSSLETLDLSAEMNIPKEVFENLKTTHPHLKVRHPNA